MKFNKMTSYAIRVVGRMYLEEGKVITSNVIANKEQIPKGVLMKVLRQLRNAGIIKSHQGRGELTGGFSLAMEKDEISVYNLVEAMEGDVNLYPVSDQENYDEEYLGLYEELKKINQEYVSRLDQLSISDVL